MYSSYEEEEVNAKSGHGDKLRNWLFKMGAAGRRFNQLAALPKCMYSSSSHFTLPELEP